MSFSLDIKNYAEKLGDDLNVVKANAAIELANAIITETPVDTGRLRGNWQASVGSPAKGELNVEDKEGTKTQAAAAKVLSVSVPDTLYLSNNLPYAQAIEYGWSKVKAPEGMVRVSIQNVIAAFDQLVAKTMK